MPRLRTVSPRSRGWTRERDGEGFRYVDHTGAQLPAQDAARVAALVIPPAWQDVWVCPHPNGHIQAVGTDEAGRRQYAYHPHWREKRDRAKHERVLDVARRLPAARATVAAHLALPGMPRERALATAFRLLDLGYFRVGGETYAESNATFGLATIECRHVSIDGPEVVFDYVAKSHKDRRLVLRDDAVRDSLAGMLARGAPGESDLLAWQDEDGTWCDIASTEINAYVKDVISEAEPVASSDEEPSERALPGPVDVSAKDFRTWHATVLAAMALAVSTHASDTQAARKRAVSRAMQEVSGYLGNTPAVARASYVDPRVVDLYEDGTTIEPVLEDIGEGAGSGEPATRGAVEEAVLHLLTRPAEAKRLARRSRVAGTTAQRRSAALGHGAT